MISKYPHMHRLENVLIENHGDYLIDIESVPTEWSEFPYAWLCYEKQNVDTRNGEPLWDDDALTGIIDLLYTYYRTLVDTIDLNENHDNYQKRFVGVYVQPDLTNQSSVIITQRALGHIVYMTDIKARHFSFDTPETMEQQLEEDFAMIISRLK
jgi:hypothetical protein